MIATVLLTAAASVAGLILGAGSLCLACAIVKVVARGIGSVR